MSWSDLLRRTVTVTALVACLLTIAGIAEAKFTGTRSANLTVGTAQLAQPAAVSGTYECRTGFFTEGVTFDVSSFTDSGPTGASYRYRIYKNQGTRIEGTATSTTRSASVVSTMSGIDLSSTKWTLTIESTLFNWTGPVWSRTVTCGALSSKNGPL
ncbi:hypothetical protein ASG90_13280 [Nocardioides sp. Soil797]|nr:hypothetical protein ASG90_13280 [Nocardioides sp. Soil797]